MWAKIGLFLAGSVAGYLVGGWIDGMLEESCDEANDSSIDLDSNGKPLTETPA